jgi:hypothetical protein
MLGPDRVNRVGLPMSTLCPVGPKTSNLKTEWRLMIASMVPIIGGEQRRRLLVVKAGDGCFTNETVSGTG